MLEQVLEQVQVQVQVQEMALGWVQGLAWVPELAMVLGQVWVQGRARAWAWAWAWPRHLRRHRHSQRVRATRLQKGPVTAGRVWGAWYVSAK